MVYVRLLRLCRSHGTLNRPAGRTWITMRMYSDTSRNAPLPKELLERTNMPKILMISGPTGVGKTEVAVRMAEMINGEIISCDTFQSYRGLDVGTAKPTHEQLTRIPHHMIDTHDPFDNDDEVLSAGFFHDTTWKIVSEVLSRGKVPMVVGGSMFYMRMFMRGKPKVQRSNPEVLQTVQNLINKDNSWEKSLQRLRDVDPVRADQLFKNDYKKLVRALSIYETTGNKPSESGCTFAEFYQGVDFRRVFLVQNPLELFSRIDHRCEEMLADGLIEETASLLIKGLRGTYPAAEAIGYKQALGFLGYHAMHPTEPNDTVKAKRILKYLWSLQLLSRVYARQQVKWFRKENFNFVDISNKTEEHVVDLMMKIFEDPSNETDPLHSHKSWPKFKDLSESEKMFFQRYEPKLRIFCSSNALKVKSEEVWRAIRAIRQKFIGNNINAGGELGEGDHEDDDLLLHVPEHSMKYGGFFNNGPEK